MDDSVVPTHGVTLDELCIDGLRLFEATHPPALRIAQHEHDLVKVCILLDGSFTERGGLDLRSLRQMDVLVRPSRRAHTNHYGGRGARSMLLEIPPDHRMVTALKQLDLNCASPPYVSGAAAELVRAFRDRRRNRTSSTRAAIHLLLATIANALRPDRPAWIDAVREHLALRFAERLALDQLARFAGVHPVYLSQSFRQHFGQTLTGYLRTLRVFHATELLQSKADISAIAIDCGFCDQSHLTHAFQREHGLSPGQYRKATFAAAKAPAQKL